MKTILACLNSEAHADDVLAAAIPLARRYMSHLIGLHAEEALMVYPGVYMHIPDAVYASFYESQEEVSKAIETVFKEHVKAEDFVSEWRKVNAKSITAAERMVEAARTADLVVMSQADAATDRADEFHAHEQVIRNSGRPVLHVPGGYQGDTIGQSVVIGWSQTREAARAAHDVIPLLADGAKVAIVTVSGGDGSEGAGATELARALDRHGMSPEVVQRSASRSDIVETLNREAFERGADLIVTGAFGHSRVYDFVIGAVTLELMRSAKLPVLFSR